MVKKLFLLDGMALVYRAHFALMSRPIYTSKGVNTSALYGFTQTLLDIVKAQQPTHIGVAFDTDVPTQRHIEYPDYKKQREAMPEELDQALPHVRRMLAAFNIPSILCDGFEADDIIGTLVQAAEKEGFESYMVTPDKDFGQLVSEHTFLYKPSRMGDGVEILGVPEILAKWGIERPAQVIDILGLWGDASDNIPGVPGIGEKTASKLISQYGSIENLLQHTAELKGKLKETLEANRDQALLSKRLATIFRETPCSVDLDKLRLQPPNNEQLKELLVEFEFNALGKRLFGDSFKAGRGFESAAAQAPLDLSSEAETSDATTPLPVTPNLKTIKDLTHNYRIVSNQAGRRELIDSLRGLAAFAFSLEVSRSDPKEARILGIAFSASPHEASYVPLPEHEFEEVLTEFNPLLCDDKIEKVGHDLKFDVAVLRWRGFCVKGKLFDVMLAHSLIEPDMRHSIEYLAEACLGYSPVPLAKIIEKHCAGQLNLAAIDPADLAEYACEDVDVIWQLRALLEPQLKEKGQERVFYEIETELLPVLSDMEFQGIRIDARALNEFGDLLQKQMNESEKIIYQLAGREFNVNSPKQLGEILFDVLKLAEAPKKTKSGQYATNEQTLLTLASEHDIVRRLLDYRGSSKLKSTYADTLPGTIFRKTGRVHTTYNQAATSTGRLNSENPNLQNIPIRTEQGKEIRKAFVPRDEEHFLLSADYSQIELRIIAALSKETGMLDDLKSGIDIHTATAARVFGVFRDMVTPEMRRKAKMVNYGIAYGISAFGLAQRLSIPRKEAAAIIEQYFEQYPGIAKYMRDTIEFCKKHGYVETITGRRRYLRDIGSSNATVRGSAERNAINAPIQGSAADMIKIAMVNVHREITKRSLRTRMLLQVHDELVFDLFKPEEKEVRELVERQMKNAILLEVPIVVEIGSGRNWLEAH